MSLPKRAESKCLKYTLTHNRYAPRYRYGEEIHFVPGSIRKGDREYLVETSAGEIIICDGASVKAGVLTYRRVGGKKKEKITIKSIASINHVTGSGFNNFLSKTA